MTDSIHILGSRQGGGAERFYLRLVEALNAAGHRALAVLPENAWAARHLSAAVPREHVPMRSVWDLAARWRIQRLVKREHAPIVQTYMGRATRLTHLRPNRGHVHIARLGGYYNIKGYRHAHAWVGNTRGIRDYLIEQGLPGERVFHIGNFIDLPPTHSENDNQQLRRELGLPQEAWMLFSLGRLHPNKGFPDLLAAFAQLPPEINGRTLHLVIAGDGPLREELHRQAEQTTDSSRLHFTGWVDDPPRYYQAADLFVCPSRHEPLGNVILEAWANGVPVVSTRNQGATELVTDGDNGMLVPLESPEGLAAGIKGALMLEDAERQRLAQAGRHVIKTTFSRETIVGEYLALYRALAAESARLHGHG